MDTNEIYIYCIHAKFMVLHNSSIPIETSVSRGEIKTSYSTKSKHLIYPISKGIYMYSIWPTSEEKIS